MVTALDPFSMFMLTTGPAFLKDEESIINAVVHNSYLLPRFMEGKEMSLLLQGGTKIQDILYLEEQSSAEWYAANKQDFDYADEQVGTAWEQNWRFLKNSTSWTDHEVGLQGGDSTMAGMVGHFHRFKRIQRLKYMNLWTTQVHKQEDSLLTQPHREQMEVGSGLWPMSLPAMITGRNSAGENVGLPNQGSSTSAWTTVQGIDPTAVTRWRNQVATGSWATTASAGALIPENVWTSMRELHSKCRFERLPRFGSYSNPTRSPSFYMVSLWGLICVESAMRNPQDLFLAGRQDPAWPAPMFHGVPFVYISNLNGAVIYNSYANTTTFVSEEDTTGANTKQPRVWAINGAVINQVLHRDRVIHRLAPFSPDRKPFTKVMVTDTWCNNVIQNRRECGLLQPPATGTDVTSPAIPSAAV